MQYVSDERGKRMRTRREKPQKPKKILGRKFGVAEMVRILSPALECWFVESIKSSLVSFQSSLLSADAN